MFLNMVSAYQYQDQGRNTKSLIFLLVGHIKSVDGLAGCFRGVTPKIVGNIFATHLSEKVADWVGCPENDENENAPEKEYKDSEEELEEYYKRFETKLKRDVVTHTAGAIISSPFHVISIRMMAQFVGRETKYTSIFGSIIQIYKDEGILGFFSGLIPRLIFDLSCVVVASTATYIVGRHIIREKEGRMYFGSLSSFVCSSMFYPMNVVSTCMIVNGSGLRAGSLPFMPHFDSWQHCYTSLKLSGDHKRGSSLFFRYLKTNKTPVVASRIK
jgi:carrier protein